MRLSSSYLLPVLAQQALAVDDGPTSLGSTATADTSAYATSSSAAAPSGGGAVPYQVKTPPLDTPWTSEVGTNPWPQHPRPQLRRDAWQSLNGLWTFQPAAAGEADLENPPFGQTLANEVLIPSCLESALSGIMEENVTYSWFATSFSVPSGWDADASVLLNFEAVDYEATVFINGKEAGFHRGGYFRFTIDATEYLNAGGENSLLVFVFDPTDAEPYNIPIGKQTLTPSHIFYVACTGIWQQVWLESAPPKYISSLDVSAGADGKVSVNVHSSSQEATDVEVSVIDSDGGILATGSGSSDGAFNFSVDSPDLWSPSSPTLYNLTVKMGDDEVSSYTGFRTISKGKVDGVTRPLLNGEFVFQFGTLDQGFWPDGIYVPPTYEAMVHDLHVLKDLGMNMVRKHIKVEPDLFYQACDTIGLLVIQDMPSLVTDAEGRPATADQQAEFQRQLGLLVNQHKSYPSIGAWIIYNEGWGQLGWNHLNGSEWPEAGLTDFVRELDPTRLIDATSGWHDHGFGDFSDNHHYANPQCGTPFYSTLSSPYDPARIGLQGEFGGIGHNVSIEHLWNVRAAIDAINQTYELDADLEAYNYRAHVLLGELTDQVRLYACSGAVWTQTSDVEGEVNGLVTYDRRLMRPDAGQWKSDIQGLYDAAASRGGLGNSSQAELRV